MYVSRLKINNVRSIEEFDFQLSPDELAGWHVILGANGAGKSSVVRSLALALVGPREAIALRQDWSHWKKFDAIESLIEIAIEASAEDVFTGMGRRRRKSIEAKLGFRPVDSGIGGPRVELQTLDPSSGSDRTIWGTNTGWFSASFGPFRRFTGGDQAFDRLFYSNPRLAPHLSAFGEDVALTEGLRWLRELRVKQLEQNAERQGAGPFDDGHLLTRLIAFLNSSNLLPHGARITDVKSEEVLVVDATGAKVVVEQMSDGYRSVLSMIFEILRQMTRSYGPAKIVEILGERSDVVDLPGVVIIDEVDAHLHPSWQKEIGPWFTRCFPKVQFIVTTHSPIICRTATSVWRLRNPGTDEASSRIEGVALNRLIHGSILDAYGTEFFGRDVARSNDSKALMHELALLNRKALKAPLDPAEKSKMSELRAMLPTRATDVAPG